MEDPDLIAIDRLLAAARRGNRGWSQDFGGGPERVAMAADRAAELAGKLVSELVDLRTVALAQVLETSSLREVEARTGINRSTISKAGRAWDADRSNFTHLNDEESW